MLQNEKRSLWNFHFPVICHKGYPRILSTFVLIRFVFQQFPACIQCILFTLTPNPVVLASLTHLPRSPFPTFRSFCFVSWPTDIYQDHPHHLGFGTITATWWTHHFIFNWGQWLSLPQNLSVTHSLAGKERAQWSSPWFVFIYWQSQAYTGPV